MPVRFKVETKGLEDYMEQLQRLGGDIDAAADEALDAGGAVLVEGMRRRAPKDTHNLERHIAHTDAQQDGNFHFILVGVLNADAETARYATAQEFGWADKKGTKAAKSYLRNTIDEDMKLARKRMKETFQARIRRGGA